MEYKLSNLNRQRQGHDFEQCFQFAKEDFYEFKEKDSAMKTYWGRFMQNGLEEGDEFLQKIVLDSWKRSKEYGVDPFRNKLVVLPVQEFKEKLELYKRLSDICEVSSHCFFTGLRGAGFCVELYDKDVTLLKQYGDPYIINEIREIGISPGVNRSEQFAGTNSAALAAILKKPVTITGSEHFCHMLHTYADISVPLRHNEGELLGVLSIVSYDGFRQMNHIINLLMAVGKVIEFCYDWGKINGEIALLRKCLDDISNAVDDGIIVANNEGNVRFINKNATELLNLDTDGIVNQSVKNHFDIQSSIVKAFEENAFFHEEELVFLNRGKRTMAYGSIIPVRSNNEGCGVVAVFKDNRKGKEFTGNRRERPFFTFDDILGEAPNICRAKAVARQAAKLPFDVILHGESGTGKELFAQALHFENHGGSQPFVSINCAAIPSELMESELFGYAEGAFTGAAKGGREGIFERAKYGTLFLDEINSMPPNMQAKLLRVLQSRVFTRLGCGVERSFSARIISASNADLLAEVRKGTFREDLYYRLNVIDIHLPPLRERKQDIPLLIENCLHQIRDDIHVCIEIAPEAMALLTQYSWPGNIRELKNKVEKAVVIALSLDKTVIDDQVLRHLKFSENLENPAHKAGDPSANTLAEVEKMLVRNVLQECGGNKTKAAQKLGITRKTLYRKLRSL